MRPYPTRARKNELCGLRWSDVDFDTGRLTISRQLTKPRPAPTFGPPRARTRTVTLSADTVALRRAHKRHP